MFPRLVRSVCAILILGAPCGAQDPPASEPPAEDAELERWIQELQESRSRLSDEAKPLRVDLIPRRPRPIIEWGDSFLGTGEVPAGVESPTGSVWTPAFQVFGTYRTAVQGYSDRRGTVRSQWAHRLDIFANLNLTQTERLIVGLRPLDDEGRDFTALELSPDAGFDLELDARISTLFFEGDIGEIFPGLDPDDSGIWDFGFAVGRQGIIRQEGLLIDDRLDAFGIIRNNLRVLGASNIQLTALYAWNNLHRGNRSRDDSGQLFALFTEADYDFSSLTLDLAYIEAPSSSGDAFFAAVSGVQRIGHVNTSFRVLGSFAIDEETPFSRSGWLLFGEVSFAPTGTDDVLYFNAFVGLDDFTSAARGPDAGGPLARTGILYAAQGLGDFPSALSSDPADAAGVAVGWQTFFDDERKQLILELGGRIGTDGNKSGGAGLAARYQQALGAHVVLQVDGYAAVLEERKPGYGFRVEFLVKF